MVKHCSYGGCVNDSRYPLRYTRGDIKFHRFPDKQIYPKTCAIWARACSRTGFTVQNVTRHMFVCSEHFYGGRGPTQEYPYPIAPNEKPVPIRKPPIVRVVAQPIDLSTRPKESPATQHLEAYRSMVADKSVDRSKTLFTFTRHPNRISKLTKSGKINLDYKNIIKESVTDEYDTARLPFNAFDILELNKYCNRKIRYHVDLPIPSVAPKPRPKPIKISTPTQCATTEEQCNYIFHYPEEMDEMPFTVFPLPPGLDKILKDGWKFGVLDDPRAYTFSDTEDGRVIEEVRVELETGRYTVKMEGRDINVEDAKDFPQYVTGPSDLSRLLKLLRYHKRCVGINQVNTKCERSPGCTILMYSKLLRCRECEQAWGRKKRKGKRLKLGGTKLIPYMEPHELRDKLRKEKSKSNVLEKKLERCRRRLQQTIDKYAQYTENEIVQDVSTIMEHDADNSVLLMVSQQLRAEMVSRKSMRWHPTILQWAAQFRLKYASAYNAMRKSPFFNLPSRTTTHRILRELRSLPGPNRCPNEQRNDDDCGGGDDDGGDDDDQEDLDITNLLSVECNEEDI